MATELDHTFTTDKSAGDAYESILDLERLVPAVEGGSVTGKESDDKVNAEIVMRMGAMSMKLIGTVEVVEKDDAAHRAVVRVRSREEGGTGHADADVTFQVRDGGGDIHTSAKITGKAASMGEGVVIGVLDALIKDFTTKVGQI